MDDRQTTAPAADPHQVTNQPPALVDYNLFETDPCLHQSIQTFGGDWATSRLHDLGATLGRNETIELGRQANSHVPVLRSHDRFGHRIDEVEFHPAWHALMSIGRHAEIHALPWNYQRPGAQVARAAMAFLMNQVDSGVCCPFAMTWAAVPVLDNRPEIAAQWRPKLCSTDYDSRALPLEAKAAASIGMAMTEKQGGSDLRSNATEARPEAKSGSGRSYRLTGHKWFCSAPMSDVFLTLAQSPKGLSCFLVPRWLSDGTINPIRIQRLKDKLGNRSNASAEIEYSDTYAVMIGDEGRGIATIIEMAQRTRLDVSICSAALMRQALVQALHHARHRTAFQRRLIDQPLMTNVLADLTLESEAATVLVMRLAQAYDQAATSAEAGAFARIVTAIAKFWISARAPAFVFEAMQCLGGNGYIEESIMPRLYREAPLSAIWEGCGNIICLDLLRVLEQEPEALEVLSLELQGATGFDHDLDLRIAALPDQMTEGRMDPSQARHLSELAATTLQAALLCRYGRPETARAFLRRLREPNRAWSFGALPADLDFAALLSGAYRA